MRFTAFLNQSFYTLLLAITVATTAPSFATTTENGKPWLGAEFRGLDNVTGKSCSVRIAEKMNESFFGDTILTSIKIDSYNESFSLTNHPIFGGSTFGKTFYVASTEQNLDGVWISIIDEYWVEVSIENSGKQINYLILHLGKKHGGLMITEPRGKLTECSLSKI